MGRALLLLLLSCSAGLALCKNTPFDFFFFVRQWPATYCDDHKCFHSPPDSTSFTIHGLWPENRDHTWPQFCSAEKLDPKVANDMEPVLKKYWPSYGMSNYDFWNHEWERHGTCAAPYIKNPYQFFGTVIGLHDEYPLQEALKAAKIVPSDYEVYDIDVVEAALEAAFGVKALVHCDSKQAITEVWMCFSHHFEPLDCDFGVRDSNYCKDLKYPILRSDLPTAAAGAPGGANAATAASTATASVAGAMRTADPKAPREGRMAVKRQI